jgi:hypothetical protein
MDEFRNAGAQQPLEVARPVEQPTSGQQVPPAEYNTALDDRGSGAGAALLESVYGTSEVPTKQEGLAISIDAHRKGPETGALEQFVSHVPFAGSLWEVAGPAGLINAKKAVDRYNADTQTVEDLNIIGKFLVDQERSEEEWKDAGVWDYAKAIMADLPKYMVEFALTGGAYTVGKAGIKKLVKEGVKSRVKSAVVGTVARGVGVAAQAAASPQLYVPGALRRQIESGLSGDDLSFLEALPAAYADAFIEMGTERAGGLIGKAAGKIPGIRQAKKAIGKAWVGAVGGRTSSDLSKAVASQVGWHGVIGEIGEERLGDILRGTLGSLGVEGFGFGSTGGAVTAVADLVSGNEVDTSAFKQLAGEAIALSVPGAGSVSLQAAQRLASGTASRGDVAKVLGKDVADTLNRKQRLELVAEAQQIVATLQPPSTENQPLQSRAVPELSGVAEQVPTESPEAVQQPQSATAAAQPDVLPVQDASAAPVDAVGAEVSRRDELLAMTTQERTAAGREAGVKVGGLVAWVATDKILKAEEQLTLGDTEPDVTMSKSYPADEPVGDLVRRHLEREQKKGKPAWFDGTNLYMSSGKYTIQQDDRGRARLSKSHNISTEGMLRWFEKSD